MTDETKRLRTSADVYAKLNSACRAAGGRQELARKAGLSRQFVEAVERGEKRPSAVLLAALGFRRVEFFEEIS